MSIVHHQFEPADRHNTLTDQVASIVRERILSGDLAPGARLPGEQQLAEAFEVSRTVIREAIARLRVDGLVMSKQGLGTFVGENLAVPRLDAESLQANKRVGFVFELRSIMEPDIVSLAARRRTDEQMQRIEEAMAGFETSVKTSRGSVDADLALHHAIAIAAGNPLFVSLMEFTQTDLRDTLVASHRSLMTLEGSLMRVHKEHEAIFRAIRDRNETAARRAAATHLTYAANRMSITFS